MGVGVCSQSLNCLMVSRLCLSAFNEYYLIFFFIAVSSFLIAERVFDASGLTLITFPPSEV